MTPLSPRPWPIVGAVAVVIVLGMVAVAGALEPIQEVLREKIERLRHFKTLQVGSAFVASTIVVPDFYEGRAFRLAWEKRAAVDDLLRAIRDSAADGLDPRDYHLDDIELLRQDLDTTAIPPLKMLADFDILLSDALVRLGYHLMFGKVDPERLDANWNLSRQIIGFEPAVVMQRAVDSNSLYRAIAGEKPQHMFYRQLKEALETYRQIQAMGGWPLILPGPTLKPGMQDARLPLLHQRLGVTGDIPEGVVDGSPLFDEALAAGVRRFQKRHGLAEDGAVGPATLEALNVPVRDRINQLRVNLERGRWVLHHLEPTFILVNIAGYRVYYVEHDRIVWQGRAQVGRPYRQTPIFRSEMTYLVFNLTWTVPPTILTNDYLPELRRNHTYLRGKNFKVIDRSGIAIDPGRIDWSRYSGRNFPYLLRQEPGPQNALGRVKFIFPNEHSIFLHDTPNQALFGASERAFSSGCIRVEHALELARLLLHDKATWDAAAIDHVLASGSPRTVFLPQPMPVLLLYWTAWVGADGQVNFRKDLYDRDAPILAALGSGFRFRNLPVIGLPSR